MKSWAFTVILLSLCGKLIKLFLPKGEKSPLFSPLRFLLSLSLIIALISPLIGWKGWFQGKAFPFEYETTEGIDSNRIILKRMGETIKKSVDTAFPQCEYSLEIYTDEQGLPQSIRVVGGGEKATEITEFIYRNYGLKTDTDQGE